jgi:hypothetical protein
MIRKRTTIENFSYLCTVIPKHYDYVSRGQVCDTLAGGAWRHTMSSFLLLLCHNRFCLEKKDVEYL